jgi:hypothetical protein
MNKLILLLSSIVIIAGTANAQLKEGDNLLGISFGFWPVNNSPIVGANFESQISQAGIGTVGLGGLFRYYTHGVTYFNGDSRSYNFSSFGVQANYNFNQIGDGRFVPSLGIVLGYNSVNTTYTDVRGNAVFISDVTYTSGAWLWGQAGFRYFFSNRVAGAVKAGFGNNNFNTLELGIDFKL